MSDDTPTLEPLALIVAVARNGVIGRDGGLPWHVPEDLKHFKRTTSGHAIIMGRRTYESIGRALPARRNIVVTRTHASFPGCEVANSLPEAIRMARETDDRPFVIGGASLFEEALPQATDIYLTSIDQDFDGDTRFIADLSDFVETSRDAAETPGVTFFHLERKSPRTPAS